MRRNFRPIDFWNIVHLKIQFASLTLDLAKENRKAPTLDPPIEPSVNDVITNIHNYIILAVSDPRVLSIMFASSPFKKCRMHKLAASRNMKRAFICLKYTEPRSVISLYNVRNAITARKIRKKMYSLAASDEIIFFFLSKSCHYSKCMKSGPFYLRLYLY